MRSFIKRPAFKDRQLDEVDVLNLVFHANPPIRKDLINSLSSLLTGHAKELLEGIGVPFPGLARKLFGEDAGLKIIPLKEAAEHLGTASFLSDVRALSGSFASSVSAIAETKASQTNLLERHVIT